MNERKPKSSLQFGLKVMKKPAALLLAAIGLVVVLYSLRDESGDASGGKSARLSSPPAKPNTAVTSKEDAEKLDDPVALLTAGQHWLKQGKRELARASFEGYIKRHEINLYRPIAETPHGEAFLLELMGEWERARKRWRSTFKEDVLTAYYFIAYFSIDPQREKLLAEAEQYLRGIVEKAKQGEKALIYVTRSGKNRYLEVVTNEEALEALAAGDKLRYAYIEELDLSNRVWPDRVSCQRCVIGTLKAWGSEFKEQLDFKGFVLGDFHLGKKWEGEVNKSSTIKAAEFTRLYLEQSVFLGNVTLDSVKVKGKVLNLPMAAFRGPADLRNLEIEETAEFRFTVFEKPVSFKGSRLRGSIYLGFVHGNELDLSRVEVTKQRLNVNSGRFRGQTLIEDARFLQGATFENSHFEGPTAVRRSVFDRTLNLSRITAKDQFEIQRVETKHLVAFGAHFLGQANFVDNVFTGRVQFALDALTRRNHLDDATPLHRLYKQYQGDDDAEEDLTDTSQYGVRTVDDLVAVFHGDTTFANSVFSKYAGFERVRFGRRDKPVKASFYNSQFEGEAHFEQANFMGVADFRTIAGQELSFNRATFRGQWMLDDANIKGRLTVTEADMRDEAKVSLAGADVASLGIDFHHILEDPADPWEAKNHRLFYEQCALAGKDNRHLFDDPRLEVARWDAEAERVIQDEEEVSRRVRLTCIERSIDEFTRLRDSFGARSMTDAGDWSYWHLKHYQNHLGMVQSGPLGRVGHFLEWLIFEKAFGWGVLLANLIVTAFVVIVFYAGLMRVFCANMLIDWDNNKVRFRELPVTGMIVVSSHAFLGGLGDAENLVVGSGKTYKYIFTSEILVGVIVITFFIGAYTRMVVSG